MSDPSLETVPLGTGISHTSLFAQYPSALCIRCSPSEPDGQHKTHSREIQGMVSTRQKSLDDLRKWMPTDHHDWLSVTTPVTGSHSACSYNFCPGAQDVFISWVQHLTQTMAKVSLGTFSLGVSAINMLGKIENEAHKNVKVNTDEF